MTKKTAVIYARQSSGKEDDSESIEMQINACQELASKNNLKVLSVFSDANCSGRLYPSGSEYIAAVDSAFQDWFKRNTLEKSSRLGLQGVMQALPEIDFVIVYDVTRLYRPVQQSFLQQHIDSQLTRNQVNIFSVKEGQINPSDFSDILVNTIKSQVNDNQLQLNREKSKQAMANLKNSGIVPTSPKMYGIKYIGGKNKQVEVIPERAEVIRYVFDNIIKLKPYNWIVRQMNAKFAERCDGKGFYQSSLRNIAAQPFYCGYMYDCNEMLIPALQMQGKEIISFDAWNKVQEIMAISRREPQRRQNTPRPFSRIMICGYCKAKMLVGQDGAKEYYHCVLGGSNKCSQQCRSARVTMNHVRLSNEFTGLKLAIAPLLALALFKELENNDAMQRKGKELDRLRIEQQGYQKRLSDAINAYNQGNLGLDIMQKIETGLKGKIAKNGAEINKIENAQLNAAKMEKKAKEYLAKMDDLMHDRLEIHVFEDLLRSSVKQILCYDNYVIFKTVYGEFKLDRYIKGKFRNFPKFTYEIEKANPMETDLRKCKLHITYIYDKNKKESLIIDFGVMKIYEKK